ncbi:MAG: hypothetical protein PHQ52_04220 [Candidatus Omnitrophica bacterium]|jgi:outer membrane biosynthesis protein TonB|nr:hypothetical protein [Candidatus Omnitrophota bacterium]
MSEVEKKEQPEEKQIVSETPAIEETVVTEKTPSEQPKAASPVEEPPLKEKPKKVEIVKPQKEANCPVCKKPMKSKWYYRNLKYYCCKGCFKQDTQKKETSATEVS